MMHRFKIHAVSSALFSGASEVSDLRSIKLSILGRDRSLPHLGRKFYHCLMGLICFSLYAFLLTREESLLALGVIGGSFVLGDLIRLRFSQVNQVALRLFGKLMRREELKSVSGNSFFVLGLLTIVLFFPKNIVLLAVLFLAVGDPSAAIFGTLYGKRRLIGKKSLEGSLANYAFSAFAALLYGSLYLQLSMPQTFLLAGIGGLISVVAELFPSPVDDNFSIPVLSAVLLSIVQSIYPIL